MTDKPVLTLRDLSIEFPTPHGVVQAVKALSLDIHKGRRVGFIGESGSGKTTTALAVMQMLAEPGRVAGGTVDLGGTDVLGLSEDEMRRTRLNRVAYIPQGAMNSLNPVMRVEPQMWDGIIAHEGNMPRAELKRRSDAALASVGLPEHTGQLYPHELSGGMKQRVCIAMGIILNPDLIIADEPTSALDVVTQRQVMQTLKDIQREIGSGLMLIGHDMGLMAQTVDELDYGSVTALHPMSFTLQGDTPQIISIVGQSGSGKSTMGSIMLGFNPPSEGRVLYEGQDVQSMNAAQSLEFRKNVQAVFQDPYACFNPFYRVNHALKFPFKQFGLAQSEAHTQTAMEEACQAVGLDPDLVLTRYPHQLSGGQRQRLIVARALMLSPKLLIADEPVSMVDASLRASILSNIYDLKDKYGISILYITHDLATAYHVSDYVMVLFKGHVVEAGAPKDVIGAPQHPYTQLLIDSIPWPDLDRSWGDGKRDWDPTELEAQAERVSAVYRGDVAGFDLARA